MAEAEAETETSHVSAGVAYGEYNFLNCVFFFL